MIDSLEAALPGPVVAILGPTAVGKSAVADELARRMHTSVISADAMQVYRGMDIGTAKTPVDERLVPLHMVDVVDVDEPYSAALFQRDARRLIDDQLASGLLSILCGGTGLYVRAVLDEMEFPAGEVDSSSRRVYTELHEQLGDDGLYALLRERDSESAAIIHPHNSRRVIRALEMLDEGVSYAQQVSGFSRPRAHYRSVQFALSMDRERLYGRIDRRVDRMLEQGLVDEVRSLLERGQGDALTSRQAIGYKEIIDCLEGRCTLSESVETVKLRSRRYAKRQLSWFRRDSRIQWLDMDRLSVSEAAGLIQRVLEDDHVGC